MRLAHGRNRNGNRIHMMKAAVLETRGSEGLKVRDFPRPVPQPGEALLRVHAVGLNRVDLYMRDSGVGITHALPIVQGVEAAGVDRRSACPEAA